MNKFSIFQAPLYSFFSKVFYGDVGAHGRGTGFAYIFLLLLVCWIPIALQMHSNLSAGLEKHAPGLIEKIPTVTIKDGKASMDCEQPYYLVYPPATNVIAIFDATGEITSLDGRAAYLLVKESEVIVKQSEVETRSYSMADVKDFVLTREKLTDWAATGQKWLVPVLYPILLIGSFVGKMIRLLIYAAIGMIFVNVCRASIPYLSVLRLSAVANTPAIILSTILMLAHINLPGIVYLIITLIYLYIAVKATAGEISSVDAELTDPNTAVV